VLLGFIVIFFIVLLHTNLLSYDSLYTYGMRAGNVSSNSMQI
jgi:hypothetical protein